MTVTPAQVTAFVGASPADATFVDECLSQAQGLVDPYAAGCVVPDADTASFAAASDRAVLEVASELFHRRQAPMGMSQYAAEGVAPIRVARDPMVAAYPLLKQWAVGFA